MPLARIFTRNPERTADLSSQLQQQGYKIEVVSPDQKHLAPADLEIEFEICERADVLERAADLASELEADVAVAPGILQAVPEPIAPVNVQAAAQAVAPIPVEIKPVEMKPAEQPKLAEQKTDLEREFEAAFSSTAEKPAAMQAEVIEIPVMEHAPLPPVAFAEDAAAAMMEPVRIKDKPIKDRPIVAVPVHLSESSVEPISVEPNSVEPVSVEPVLSTLIQEQVQSADPMPYLAQLTPFSSPARQEQSQVSSAARRPEVRQSAVRQSAVRGSEKAAQAAELGKQVLQDGAKIAAKTWAGALALSSSTADTVRDQFRVYKKRAQVRSAEQRAAQAAKMLDLEQRRAEAQQRAQELEAARIAASVRLTELLQQRAPGLQEQSQREQGLQQNQLEHGLWQPSTYAHSVYKDDTQRRDVAPVASSMKQAPPVTPASRSKAASAAIKTTPAALWSKVTPPFRAVLTGAAAVSALFVMGIALGVFHSHDPLASPANHASASNGAATQNAGATAQTGETAQAASAKPPQGTEAQADVQTVAKTQSPAKPSPRVQRAAQLVSQQAETNIGDDVVIRRFSRPVPTQQPKQAGQQAGLKHFSDLDN